MTELGPGTDKDRSGSSGRFIASGMFYSGAVYLSTPQVVVVPPPAAAPPPAQFFRDREVIREIVKIPCRYCGTLVLQTAQRCPNCNAPFA